MAKPKGSLNKLIHVPGPPKKTKQGQGQHSKPNHSRKKLRGQGK